MLIVYISPTPTRAVFSCKLVFRDNTYYYNTTVEMLLSYRKSMVWLLVIFLLFCLYSYAHYYCTYYIIMHCETGLLGN